MHLSLQITKFHMKIWKVCALYHWPGEPLWYKAYCWLVVLIIYIPFPGFITMELFFSKNIYDMADAFLYLPTALAGFKGMLVCHNHDVIMEMFEYCRILDFLQMPISEEYRQPMYKGIWRSKFFSGMVVCFYYSCLSLNLLKAIVSDDHSLMWASWWPMEYRIDNFGWYCAVFYQFVATTYMVTIFSKIDVFGGTMYSILAAHLDVIGQRLACIGHSPEEQAFGWFENSTIAMRYKLDNEIELNKCVVAHRYCLKIASNLNDILSMFYMVQFGISILALCTSEFMLSYTSPLSQTSRFIAIFSYIVCMLIQIYVPCYCASIATDRSDWLSRLIYSGIWWTQSKRYKASMLVFIECAKTPIIPVAGGLFDIGLSIFVKILKTGYSLFACVKNMEKVYNARH